MVKAALPLLMAGALVGAACSADSQGVSSSANSSGLSEFIPDQPGSGLPEKLNTQEVLDVSEASKALPTPPGATLEKLNGLHYRSGFARIWGTPTDYVTMVVLALPSSAAATSVVEFERNLLATAANTYVTSHAAIPASFVFVISSPTQASGNQDSELCNGVWFSYRGFAYESLACGSTPSWATQIEESAKALYDRARERSA